MAESTRPGIPIDTKIVRTLCVAFERYNITVERFVCNRSTVTVIIRTVFNIIFILSILILRNIFIVDNVVQNIKYY